MEFNVPRMNPLQSRAWLALVSTCQLLPAALDQQLLADAQLTHFEYVVLGTLFTADGRVLRMSRLAEATSATLPRLSKVVRRLDARGLVERRTCPGDGRATNVHLTQAGRKAWVQATPAHLAMARDRVLADLTDEQLTAIADALSIIVGHLGPEPACPPLTRQGDIGI